MIGNPKYSYGDKVQFTLDGEDYEGTIYIIDKYGTFEDDSDVSYDVMVISDKFKSEFNPNGECLFKHLNEKLIK